MLIHPTLNKPPAPPHPQASPIAPAESPKPEFDAPRPNQGPNPPEKLPLAASPQSKDKYNSREYFHARDPVPLLWSIKSRHPSPRNMPPAPCAPQVLEPIQYSRLPRRQSDETPPALPARYKMFR